MAAHQSHHDLDGLFDGTDATHPRETLFPAIASTNGSACGNPNANTLQCIGKTLIQNADFSCTNEDTHFTTMLMMAKMTRLTIANVKMADLSSLVSSDVLTVNTPIEVDSVGGGMWVPAFTHFDFHGGLLTAHGDALTSFGQGFTAEIDMTSGCATAPLQLTIHFATVNGKLDANKGIGLSQD